MIPKNVITTIFAGLALTLANCAPKIETKPVAAELPPAEARQAVAGDTWVVKNVISGQEVAGRYLTVDDGIYSWEDDRGCKSIGKTGTFAIYLSWENCSGSTGSQTYDSEETLFPLEIGKSVTHRVKGKNDRGDTWETSQTCEVVETVRVNVPAGEYDTYHVRCEDTWNVRNFYYAPELGVQVISIRSRKDRNDVRHTELVSFTPGTTS